jgi:23S rRNA (cytosine1962-C5)-methyltransferase
MQSCIFLKPGKEVAILRGHPWVFSGAIHRIAGQVQDGDVVQVCDRAGDPLGMGHYHNGSIAVRLLHFGAMANLNGPDFWIEKFRDAFDARLDVGLGDNPQTNCYRLIHGEGDGLSGLIIDIYNRTAVLQCHSIGMHRQRALLAEALQAVLGERIDSIYDKSAESLPPQYAAGQSNGYLWLRGAEPQVPVQVHENGVPFLVDWINGQKTGFFLDQRDNRQLLQRFVAGKKVLNAFCYTGGFSLYALQAGAAMVHSVDVSAKAIALTNDNVAQLPAFAGSHEGYAEDVLKFLRADDSLYDVMVVDPPAYAKTLDKRHNAVQGYKRLNMEALRRLKPGGILFTFSCSQVVDRELFYNTIVAAAMEAGRPARVLHHLTQGADHPVSLFHPEGSYLKGLVIRG